MSEAINSTTVTESQAASADTKTPPPLPPEEGGGRKFSPAMIVIGFLVLIIAVGGASWILINPAKSENETANQVQKESVKPVVIASPTPSSPNLISDKKLIAESEQYQIFAGSPIDIHDTYDQIVLVDKNTSQESLIVGNFNFSGAVSISTNEDYSYLIIDTGTYITRGKYIISLQEMKKLVEFCSVGKLYFWQSYVIYANCDRPENKQVVIDVAPSIVALNLTDANSTPTVLFKSTDTSYYGINQLDKTRLLIDQSSVDSIEDWYKVDPQISQVEYDLNQLL